MKENKNIAIFLGVAIVVFIVVLIAGLVILFGGSDKSSSSGEQATTKTAVQDVEPVVLGVNKDSILKSIDSGKSFETYLFIATESNLGAVDVLNITFHPETKDRIVVSTYDDGLFLNENGVNKWEPIVFPQQKIYSFILDEEDPDNRAFASGVISENGRIFRTDDGGESWSTVYAEPGNKTYVSALTQDPLNGNIIIAGTSAGTLVRSVDGGDTWKNIGQKISSAISYFTHDSAKNSLTYLLMKGGKIYHSYDSGVTWLNWEEEKVKEIKAINTRASELYKAGDKEGSQYLKDQAKALQTRNRTEKTPSGIIYIIADPNRSGVLYASLAKGLYRSTDYGKFWSKVNIIESAEKFPILSIAINPNNSDEISFVSGNSFYRSVNYGSTWAITPLDKTRNASFVAYDPYDPSTIYVGLSAKK